MSSFKTQNMTLIFITLKGYSPWVSG